MRRLIRGLLAGVIALHGALAAPPAVAGVLTRAELEQRFAPPLIVGDKADDVPAWPISNALTPDDGPVAWAFESIDVAPIPGFEGTPFNLLIALDARGAFVGVDVISQHEPVFLGGLGIAPLHEFVRQYADHNLRESITVSTVYGASGARAQGNQVVLDGITKATASVRIVNQTVLTSAVAIARAKLGFAAPASSGPPARARADVFEPRGFAELLKSGAIATLRLSNREVEALFADSDAAGLDPAALTAPDDTYIELHVAWLNAPSIGRAILGDAGYAELQRALDPGQHAWWVASAGRAAFIDNEFVRATAPRALVLRQGEVAFELRDGDFDPRAPPGAPPLNAALVLIASPLSGIDPGSPQTFELTLERARGAILPDITRRGVQLVYQAPEHYLERPPAPLPEWLQAWQARQVELAVIIAALALLTIALARPRWSGASATRLARFRFGFLAFTLIYLGWYAQGQLSIVQLTGAVKTLSAGHTLASFLYDPVSLLLIAFTFVTFFVWGRGTFCGWLCPFGALQEFIAHLARLCRIPQKHLYRPLARALSSGRYALLAILVASAAFAPDTAARLVELEPFKTAITVGFDRAWPYVAYAVALLALGAVVYKFFCRYLCPLGAFMVIGGKLRLQNWLPRRPECGQPCQLCRHTCNYDAIHRDGRIDYDDCFQCLDCVSIYHDPQRCVPVVVLRNKGRRI
ncbi:MAG: 4Fe-4S binding protein [Rhodocyclales bacterium]|nr:4Fe-4S binding protein [Rhodocyclales bacterium]